VWRRCCGCLKRWSGTLEGGGGLAAAAATAAEMALVAAVAFSEYERGQRRADAVVAALAPVCLTAPPTHVPPLPAGSVKSGGASSRVGGRRPRAAGNGGGHCSHRPPKERQDAATNAHVQHAPCSFFFVCSAALHCGFHMIDKGTGRRKRIETGIRRAHESKKQTKSSTIRSPAHPGHSVSDQRTETPCVAPSQPPLSRASRCPHGLSCQLGRVSSTCPAAGPPARTSRRR